MENAIDTLPPELRRLMRLRYLDGMTCEQVCVELPCSWDTFHRWHKRHWRCWNNRMESYIPPVL
ncbi:MAG: helix-turn-helix domain-containing protein [Ruminococcus sp.]